MTKNKHKSSLSEKEREMIRDMKRELKRMNIPREEWAQYIQQELTYRRSMERKTEKQKSSGIFGRLKKLWQKIVGWFFKQTAKRYTQNEELIEEFYKMMEEPYQPTDEEKKFMDMLNPNVEFQDVDKLGKGGATISEGKKKKRVVLDLDDDDFE
ncbi:MAG: hypothetical protein GF311_21225 [Candidatus Lokiarchaeota archaeon]|nr:hypothetical protein [Candidatus Lokiarchaeota archaeon]